MLIFLMYFLVLDFRYQILDYFLLTFLNIKYIFLLLNSYFNLFKFYYSFFNAKSKIKRLSIIITSKRILKVFY